MTRKIREETESIKLYQMPIYYKYNILVLQAGLLIKMELSDVLQGHWKSQSSGRRSLQYALFFYSESNKDH